MKKIILSISLLTIAFSSFAQDVTKDDAEKLRAEADKLKTVVADTIKAWTLGGVISVNGQQVSLTNWAAGGNNSISIGGLVNVFARYKKGKIVWDNRLELGYGVIKQGTNKKWWKNDDRYKLHLRLAAKPQSIGITPL